MLTLNKKNATSLTPLKTDLNALIFELNVSANAFDIGITFNTLVQINIIEYNFSLKENQVQ